MSDILYLASQSKARQRLLERCKINYEVLRHDADECVVFNGQPFDEYVLSIASQKMDHVVMPQAGAVENKEVFVLVADTLVRDSKSGEIMGKPKDKDDAIRMLDRKNPFIVTTGCVIEKKIFDGTWKVTDRREFTVSATVEFIVDDLKAYFENLPIALKCSGAGHIEGFGEGFLKSINGSYSAVIGIPMYELRQTLKSMGFN